MFSLSQLRPIDIHFGNALLQAYRGVSGEGLSDGFRSFLAREEKDKIFRGRYDSPVQFLAALRKYQEQQVSAQVQAGAGSLEEVLQSFNQAKLPAVWYYRNLNYRVSSADGLGQLKGIRVNDGDSDHVIDGVWLDISYRIIFTAYDTESLDALILAFLLYMQSPLRDPEITDIDDLPGCSLKRNRGFDVPFSVGAYLPAQYGDTSGLSVDVIPGVHEDGRIYAAEIAEFPVTVPVLRSASVNLSVVVPDSITVCTESTLIPWG